VRSKEEVVQEFRVQSIQDAAMKVIARRGMNEATMQEIAEEAGVAKGTIYLYFKDRDALVEKTFDTAISELQRRIDAAFETGKSFEEKLRGALAAKLAFFEEHREFFRLYHSARYLEGKRRTRQKYEVQLARMSGMLEDAMRRGEIRRMDSKRLALIISETISALIIHRLTEEKPPAESKDIDLLADAILDGIRSRS
jgi:TetR/AcrR family transcriptional regulator, fatty acid metabolism regulator protein